MDAQLESAMMELLARLNAEIMSEEYKSRERIKAFGLDSDEASCEWRNRHKRTAVLRAERDRIVALLVEIKGPARSWLIPKLSVRLGGK